MLPRLLLSLLLSSLIPGIARAEIRPVFLLGRDPEMLLPDPIRVKSPRLVPLWIGALRSGQADLQRMAGEAIVRGHRGGLPDVETTIPALVEVLTAEHSHPAARLAAARALVELGAKEAAPQMAESAKEFGAEMRQSIEPALAEWKYEPMLAVWRERLTGAHTRHRDLMLAIRCLGTAGDSSAAATLVAFVHDLLQKPDVRLEAARSSGLVQRTGWEADARRLMDRPAASVLERLCAVQLLAQHAGADAEERLKMLALDPEPAVAVVALDRLVEIDPHLVLPLAEKAMQNADAKVRKAGARSYVLVPEPARIAVLGKLLDDPHPDVRGYIRESLFELAGRSELDEPVRRTATEMLASDRWRGLEQAALLLSALDHKPAAPRLVELLDFPRPEVGVAAAWGLKTLAVPETLPGMLDKATRNTEARLKSAGPISGIDDQTAHLHEAFGKMKYAPAEPLLRRYVPKNPVMGVFSRAAAIWSLGHLHAGTVDEDLASQFLARATDSGVPPEAPLVMEMSVVSIGRMHAVKQAEALRKAIGPRFLAARFTFAARWALIESNSPPIPDLVPTEGGIMAGWFLEPVDE